MTKWDQSRIDLHQKPRGNTRGLFSFYSELRYNSTEI